MFTIAAGESEFDDSGCVIDALDECDEESIAFLTSKFTRLAKLRSSFGLKVVIISRPLQGLRGCDQIRLDPDNDSKIETDIERFVSLRVEELKGIRGADEAFRSSTRRILLDRAQGTFLWVGFAMHELLAKQTCLEIEETLISLPIGLPAIYSRMLLQIEPKRRKRSALILSWTALAMRPLMLNELASAVQSAMPLGSLQRRNIMDEVKLCGPLLQVNGNEVSLVHQSAKNYLFRRETDNDESLEIFRIKPDSGHARILQLCVDRIEKSVIGNADLSKCLREGQLQTCEKAIRQVMDSAKGSPMLPYAVEYWHEHAARLPKSAANIFERRFFQKGSIPRRNALLLSMASHEIDLGDTLERPLNVACFYGILPWAIAQHSSWNFRDLRGRAQLNGGNSMGDTPLVAAAQNGHHEVVAFLLKSGADPNRESTNPDCKGPPLSKALRSSRDRQRIATAVRLLLKAGANPNQTDHWGSSPLCYAVRSDNVAAIRELIAAGAETQLISDYTKSPLFQAAENDGIGAVVNLTQQKPCWLPEHDAKVPRFCPCPRYWLEDRELRAR